jgi:CCR4-NOT complex subunit CAF16
MVEPQMVRVLGRSAFHDTALTSSGHLSYLGGEVRNYNSFMTLSFLIIDCCCLI